jgi:hypothetical protein
MVAYVRLWCIGRTICMWPEYCKQEGRVERRRVAVAVDVDVVVECICLRKPVARMQVRRGAVLTARIMSCEDHRKKPAPITQTASKFLCGLLSRPRTADKTSLC